MDITLRKPRSEDGLAVHQLVEQSPPLDTNSLYCNLLQTSHFGDTAIAAEANGELVGFVSGYRKPGADDTYFLWQVVVGEKARGQGLAKRMIRSLMARDEMGDVTYLETTITPDNEPSQRLFQALAREWETELDIGVLFDKDSHFGGRHESEELYRIGPIRR